MSKKAPINLWGSDSSDSEDKKDIQMKPKKKVAIVAPIQDVSDEHDEISQEDEEEENVDGENDVSFDDNDDDESNEENSDAEADENEDQDVQESDNEQVDPNNEDAPFSVSVDIDQEESSEEDETHEIQEQHADIPSEEEIPLEDVSEGKPKFVKPLDYKLLKEKTNETGVIFLTQPPAEWQNEDRLVEFFEEYGKINRIKPSYQTKGKKKYLLGYYIEFQRKSVAKRVALTLNMQPIDNRDTRVLQIKYVQNFEWTELEEDDARDKLKKKLLLGEARKELKQVQQYQNYSKWFDRSKRRGKPVETSDKINVPQKTVKRYERDDDTHLNFLPIFKKPK